MAMSGLSSIVNLPLVVSTTALYFLSALIVTSGRSEYVLGVGARAGEDAGVSPLGVLPPSPLQAKAKTAKRADKPSSGQNRVISSLQSVVVGDRCNYCAHGVSVSAGPA